MWAFGPVGRPAGQAGGLRGSDQPDLSDRSDFAFRRMAAAKRKAGRKQK